VPASRTRAEKRKTDLAELGEAGAISTLKKGTRGGGVHRGRRAQMTSGRQLANTTSKERRSKEESGDKLRPKRYARKRKKAKEPAPEK